MCLDFYWYDLMVFEWKMLSVQKQKPPLFSNSNSLTHGSWIPNPPIERLSWSLASFGKGDLITLSSTPFLQVRNIDHSTIGGTQLALFIWNVSIVLVKMKIKSWRNFTGCCMRSTSFIIHLSSVSSMISGIAIWSNKWFLSFC